MIYQQETESEDVTEAMMTVMLSLLISLCLPVENDHEQSQQTNRQVMFDVQQAQHHSPSNRPLVSFGSVPIMPSFIQMLLVWIHAQHVLTWNHICIHSSLELSTDSTLS